MLRREPVLPCALPDKIRHVSAFRCYVVELPRCTNPISYLFGVATRPVHSTGTRSEKDCFINCGNRASQSRLTSWDRRKELTRLQDLVKYLLRRIRLIVGGLHLKQIALLGFRNKIGGVGRVGRRICRDCLRAG